VEVPNLQGTDNGPQAHPGRGGEPAGGASILSRATFLSFVPWDFDVVSSPTNGHVTTHDLRETL
jgi:hypothetical protein